MVELGVLTRLPSVALKLKRRTRLWLDYYRALPRYRRNRKIEGIDIDAPPIFVVGCSHSGTSLALAVLGAHSRIYAYPAETLLAYQTSAKARHLLKRFRVLTIAAGKRRWVEKSPLHVRRIPRILDLCPDARILLIVRDGRDVACSIRDRHGSLEEGAKRWVDDNLVAREFWSHPSVCRFKYEDLVRDFRSTVEGILGFLGEDYEEQMERHHEKPILMFADTIERPPSAMQEHHDQYRNWQLNQPLFDGSGRWKQLSDEERAMVEGMQGELLFELGYLSGTCDR